MNNLFPNAIIEKLEVGHACLQVTNSQAVHNMNKELKDKFGSLSNNSISLF